MDAFTFGLVIKSLYYYNPTKTNHKAEASFLLAEDENCELILSIIMYKWRLTFHLFHFSHLFYFVIPIENLNLVIFICSKNLYKNTMQNRMGKKSPMVQRMCIHTQHELCMTELSHLSIRILHGSRNWKQKAKG